MNQFVTRYNIEGSEDIEFEFTNAEGEQLKFEGVLNGLVNKVVDGWKATYTFNFSSKSSRANEKTHITKKFSNQDPQTIIEEMIEKLEGETENVDATGKPMSFTGGRRVPQRSLSMF